MCSIQLNFTSIIIPRYLAEYTLVIEAINLFYQYMIEYLRKSYTSVIFYKIIFAYSIFTWSPELSRFKSTNNNVVFSLHEISRST